ncbi:hypothetical protein SPWS13_3164 [Shewanella putrefaciens]|nr:hypothetical protein SPWS13_3164 [Shewanella putrefaciens]
MSVIVKWYLLNDKYHFLLNQVTKILTLTTSEQHVLLRYS